MVLRITCDVNSGELAHRYRMRCDKNEAAGLESGAYIGKSHDDEAGGRSGGTRKADSATAAQP